MNLLKANAGKCSFFGGPRDTGVGPHEGLALFTVPLAVCPAHRGLFLQPVNPALGLARQLDPDALYCAMRWDYAQTGRNALLHGKVRVQAGNGRVVWCAPADWGPNERTGRIIDLSPGAIEALGIETDAVVTVQLFI